MRWCAAAVFFLLGPGPGCASEEAGPPQEGTDDSGSPSAGDDMGSADPSSSPSGSGGDPSAGDDDETGGDGGSTGGPGSAGETGPASSDEAGESGGTPEGCYDYDAFTPTPVSFRADVMPIFAVSCASCHGNPDASVYFGLGGTTEAEATAIYAKLLEGVPKQAPHLSFVVPGDPVRSYMLAKVEYDNPGGTCSVVICMEPGCELQAPPSGQLPEPQLAVLRSWVMGGALDD